MNPGALSAGGEWEPRFREGAAEKRRKHAEQRSGQPDALPQAGETLEPHRLYEKQPMNKKLSTHERETIVKALRLGLVPRTGLQHIQVGRAAELKALDEDTQHIARGGATIRFLIGAYGSGKTFLLNLARLMAMQSGIVVASADLSPDRRLHASQGQARLLYSELVRNACTRSRPNGGALEGIIERFTHQVTDEAETTGQGAKETIERHLEPLIQMAGGYEYINVMTKYQQAYDQDRTDERNAILRWLHGDYATRTEARQSIEVRTIIDDRNVYDHIRLLAAFVKCAGYQGMLVTLDEMATLSKLTSTQARRSNLDQILYMLNDIYQGSTRHLGFILAGTPEFVTDERRGLYSYEALASRLQENTYATGDLVDLEQPIIRLGNLTPEDLYVLLGKVRDLTMKRSKVTDQAIKAFMAHCYGHIGEAYFRTPRTTVTAFVNLIAVLEQNPTARWENLLKQTRIAKDIDPNAQEWEDDEQASELSDFQV